MNINTENVGSLASELRKLPQSMALTIVAGGEKYCGEATFDPFNAVLSFDKEEPPKKGRKKAVRK